VLEQAHLRFADSDLLLRQLARSYLDDGKPFVAAELLARAAYQNPAYRLEAAELYRRAGRLHTAMYYNEQATDQRGKIRQRLGILIELERFEEAASLGPRLSRLGLLVDENIVYALAYALFKTHRFEEAEQQLRRLTRPELFTRGAELRRAIEVCRKTALECG
jgi:tetratricopeptide (TPR) repeat protein